MNVRECSNRAEYGRCIAAAAENSGDCSFLKDKTLLITGATGLVGGALCRALLYIGRVRGLRLRLLLPVRSLASAEKDLYGVIDRPEVSVFEADLSNGLRVEENVDYIVHAASPTASKEFTARPATVLESVLTAGMSLLTLAKEKKPAAYLYVSSMEAFGVTQACDHALSESEIGFVDLSSVRSCYPEGKRVNELMALCASAEFGLNALSVRLAQTFGAGVRPSENRVFAQFIRSARAGEDLVLHTRGLSVGNYLHISDCVTALIALLRDGKSGETYTAVGDDCSLRIRELAQTVSDTLTGGACRVRFDIPENTANLPYAPDTEMRLSNAKLKSLGWNPAFGIKDAIRSLAKDLDELSAEVRK